MNEAINSSKRQRVAIVGAGGAGCAAAWSLSRFPDKFDVTVYESENQPGGVAYESQGFNEGVQGGSLSYRNTLQFVEEILGEKTTPVAMTVSFGKGEDHNWHNYQDAKILKQHRREIKRLGWLLQLAWWLEPLSICIPIHVLLWLAGFSKEFGARLLYPLTALFFGTGNQTQYVPAAVLARVFFDPDLRLFYYDQERLLSNSPEMFSFPLFSKIYPRLAELSERNSQGHTRFHFNTPIKSVQRPSDEPVIVETEDGQKDEFDQIIFACDAETALKLLGNGATFAERQCLGSVEYFYDITVVHSDVDYMRRHYDIDLDRDMYFIRTYDEEPEKGEMSFLLSNYQVHSDSSSPSKPNNSDQSPVFQSIFLDNQERHRWSIDNIDEHKISRRVWWRQFAHTYRHFTKVVPWVRFINTDRTLYCGSWTMFNTHEIAIISGLAAAHRLGAPYPFYGKDELAGKQFNMYLNMILGIDDKGRGFFARHWLASTVCTIGVLTAVMTSFISKMFF